MSESLTLLAVHAHPDDEAIGTGGLLARAAAEGIRTVLVTCTNGELGDLPGGIKPDQDGHDTARVVEARLEELRVSCEILGVQHLELLGYHDSGMMGWPQNDRPDAFWHASVDDAAQRIADVMRRYRPQVVVTYDENGFYGHPDHIQANRATMAAAELTEIPRKIYYTAVGRKRLIEMAANIAALVPDRAAEWTFDPENPPFGINDDEITTTIDVTAFAAAKRASMAAHASQSENMEFLALPEAAFAMFFGRESFVRVFDTTGEPTPEDDLFAGLRDS